MRCVLCALSVCLLLGCRNQSTQLANPFLKPNRVPPPATRVLLPGTAQPYYPGDPLPSTSATGFPAQTNPPQPGAAYPAAQSPQPTYGTPTPTTPPGGWNNYPSGASLNTTGPNNNIRPASAEFSIDNSEQTVRVQSDQQNLRFAQAPAPAFGPVTSFASAPQVTAQSYSQADGRAAAPMPSQSILPPPQNIQFAGTNVGAPTTQPVYEPVTQRVRIREISPAELAYTDPSRVASNLSNGRDGFRPQGSFNNSGSRSLQFDGQGSYGAPVTPVQHVAQWDNAQRYGNAPNYEWLRGQIEYLQSTGQWKLRYVPIQGATAQGSADQFGGSVLIENPHVLGNLRPGDFVQVRGVLRPQQATGLSFSPVYAVAVVQRQRQRQ